MLPEVFLVDSGPVVTVQLVNGGDAVPELVDGDGGVFPLTDNGGGMFSSADLTLAVDTLATLNLQVISGGSRVDFSFDGAVNSRQVLISAFDGAQFAN